MADRRYREASVRVLDKDGDGLPSRIRAVAATDAPVRAWDGAWEVLPMTDEAADLTRLRNNAPFLTDHRNSIENQIGVVERAEVADGELVADIRLASTGEKAQAYKRLLADEMGNKLSIGYEVDGWERDLAAAQETYRATPGWKAFEISAVAVPADDAARVTHTRTLPEGAATRSARNARAGVRRMDDDTQEANPAKRDAEIEEARQAEAVKVRDNSAAIVKLGREYEERGIPGSADKAMEAISAGHDMDWLRGQLDELVGKRIEGEQEAGARRMKDAEVGLSAGENKRFSLLNLARAMAFPDNSGFQKDAGLELEACAEARTKNQAVDGYTGTGAHSLPAEFYNQPLLRQGADADAVRAEMGKRLEAVGIGGYAADGGAEHLVDTVFMSGSFFDLLRNTSVLLGRVVPMPGLTGNIEIPYRKTAVTVDWVEEVKTTGGGYASTDGDFDTITMSPHKLYADVPMSHTSLIQTSPGIETLMRIDLTLQKALKVDAGGLAGAANDVKNPTGITNIAGISTSQAGTGGDTNGIQPDAKLLFGMLGRLSQDNAVFPDTTFAISPKMRYHCSAIELGGSGSGRFLYDWLGNGGGMGRLVGRPTIDSNQMPKSTSARGTKAAGAHETIYAFSPRQVLFGTWGTDDVQLDPYTRRKQGLVVLSIFGHHDFQVRYPQSIVRRQYVANE